MLAIKIASLTAFAVYCIALLFRVLRDAEERRDERNLSRMTEAERERYTKYLCF